MASCKSLLAVYQCAHSCKRQSCKSAHANSCKSRTLKLRPRHLPTRSTLKTWNCQTTSGKREKKNAFGKGYDTGTYFTMKDVLVLSLVLFVHSFLPHLSQHADKVIEKFVQHREVWGISAPDSDRTVLPALLLVLKCC
ncbi:unnamed protein product [Ixodes pacificus]